MRSRPHPTLSLKRERAQKPNAIALGARTLLIEKIYRYPVKGLNAEALDSVDLAPGQALPWDRAFALAQGDAKFDPAAPAFLPKSNFMCLLKNARIAGLRAAFDPHDGLLSIRAPDGSEAVGSPLNQRGRAALGTFLSSFLSTEARGDPIFHYVPGHVFGDNRQPVVSLISLSSLERFEKDIGAERDRMRFRGNLYLSGGAPWIELGWAGKHLSIGTATFRVVKRIRRCDATQVNPVTAERDADPVRELMRTYNHADLGVYMEVVEGGRISVGDALTLIE